MPQIKATIHLRDREEDTRLSDLAVYVTDRSGEILERADVDEEGRIKIEKGALAKAGRVFIARRTEEPGKLRGSERLDFHPQQFQEMIEAERIELSRARWVKLFHVRVCVDGRASHCHLDHWRLREMIRPLGPVFATSQRIERTEDRFEPAESFELDTRSLRQPTRRRGPLDFALSPLWPWHWHCHPICEGLVEVYQRVCCCKPWIIHDPRIPELLDALRAKLDLKVPPPPPGDPVEVSKRDFERSPVFTGGTVDRLSVNAARDLRALESLKPAQQVEYINARPHLFCWTTCGEPVHRASGYLLPDGSFDICWSEPLRILFPNCRVQYAFVVKQLIGGQTVTVYDGLAANRWFDRNDDIELRTWHPSTLSCPHPQDLPEEGDDAFVYLETVGGSDAHRIALPEPSSGTSVNLFSPNDDANMSNAGLLDPVPTPADAVGKYRNRNWGGTLDLYVRFSDNLKGTAKYYRLSVMETDGSGNGIGTPTEVDQVIGWTRVFPVGGGSLDTESVTLGPVEQGGEKNLFEIPYTPSTGWWKTNQYHGHVQTSGFDPGRHLIVLELFDENGNAVGPGPLQGGGGDLHFKIWKSDTGTPSDKFLDVAQPKLPHLFWFDDRPSEAEIVDLRIGGSISTDDCQFLEGTGGTEVKIGYRAYHPNERFQLYHNLTWYRGISGSGGYFVNGKPDNVGKPPAAPGPSDPQTVDQLLGTHGACSFAIVLHTHVKTTNGRGTLDGLEGHFTGAFALSKTTT